MRALRILNLGLYLFVAVMLLVVAGFHMLESVLDPTMGYANNIPAEVKSQTGWQLRYFMLNIISIGVSLVLIAIGLIYYKRGEKSSAWALIYYIAFLVVLAIAALLIYLLTLEPVMID